jgi:transposase
VAGLTRTVWRFSGDPHTPHALEQEGVWQQVFERLADDLDNEYAMIDSTIVRAHQHSAGAKGGLRGKKRSGTAKAD